jgi:hypothetical protein
MNDIPVSASLRGVIEASKARCAWIFDIQGIGRIGRIVESTWLSPVDVLQKRLCRL